MDTVDLVIESSERERPDLDFWPVGVVGRIQRLGRLFDREIQAFATQHGLDQSEAAQAWGVDQRGAWLRVPVLALLADLVTRVVVHPVEQDHRRWPGPSPTGSGAPVLLELAGSSVAAESRTRH